MKRWSAMYIDQYFDNEDEKDTDWPMQATLYFNDRISVIAYFWDSDDFREFRTRILPVWMATPDSTISIERAKFDNDSSL